MLMAAFSTDQHRTESVTRQLHESMEGCLDRVMRGTQVLFFGLAGANLRLVRVHLHLDDVISDST